MWQVYNSVERLTSTFSLQEWLKLFACLTLLSFAYLLAFGRR